MVARAGLPLQDLEFVQSLTGNSNLLTICHCCWFACTGDGAAMMARAGLPLQDLEFVE